MALLMKLQLSDSVHYMNGVECCYATRNFGTKHRLTSTIILVTETLVLRKFEQDDIN